jgi:hypothetical protein
MDSSADSFVVTADGCYTNGKLSRRSFVLLSAAFPLGCTLGRHADPTGASVRAPAVGQTWRYAKRSLFSGKLLDNQVDQVAAIGDSVRIDSHSEAAMASAKKAWGRAWLEKYIGTDTQPGPLPSEVQQPWGRVLVDPHWRDVQVYERAIPLWPTPLESSGGAQIDTQYKTPDHLSGLAWNQTMTVHGWESVKVPAGRFTALRYTNLVNFDDVDPARSNCVRKETLWFAPEVGRFVARESNGTYYLTNSVDDTPFDEGGFRWELVSFT